MTEEHIDIRENETKKETGLTREDIGSEGIEFLEKLEADNKVLHSFDKDGRLLITTKDYVGSFQLPGVNKRINIRPKVFSEGGWKELAGFLSFADYDKLTHFEGDSIVEFGDNDDLIDRAHYTLIERYKELQRQGLLKSYVLHEENSSSLRGKLLLKHQTMNDAVQRPKFFCEFDELEYDSMENRVVLQALTIVARISDDPKRRMDAMEHAQRLSAVVQKVEVAAPDRERMMHSYNRQTFRYKELHDICDKVIRESGIEDIYGGDVTSVAPKLYDMDKEFESFLENLFTKYGRFDDVRFQERDVSWKGEGLAADRTMKPDITVWENQMCKHIIDAKYKTGVITANDLYQLGFYMYEYPEGVQSVEEAFAITPETDERDVTFQYTAERSGKQVFVKRLNVVECLDLIRKDDRSKLKDLVDWLVDPSTDKFVYR